MSDEMLLSIAASLTAFQSFILMLAVILPSRLVSELKAITTDTCSVAADLLQSVREMKTGGIGLTWVRLGDCRGLQNGFLQ